MGPGQGDSGVWEALELLLLRELGKSCVAPSFFLCLQPLSLQGFWFLSHVPNSLWGFCGSGAGNQARVSEDPLSLLAVPTPLENSHGLAPGVSIPFTMKSNPFFSLCPLCHSLI